MEDNRKNIKQSFSGMERNRTEPCTDPFIYMQTEEAIACLKKQGFRITKQRKIIIDIILKEPCSCCKEVYVMASKKDSGIGIATVYRTVDALEKAGALRRRASYQLCRQKHRKHPGCLIELEDGSVMKLDDVIVKKMIEHGMQEWGLSEGKRIREIFLSCTDEAL